MLDVSAVEIRILGSLIEKQRTTPDAYPLTLNALRAACNQSTSRDPVVTTTTRRCGRPWSGSGAAAGRGSRAARTAGRRSTATCSTRRSGSSVPEQSVLAVLMLRGAADQAELRARTERLHPFASVAAVDDVLAALAVAGWRG